MISRSGKSKIPSLFRGAVYRFTGLLWMAFAMTVALAADVDFGRMQSIAADRYGVRGRQAVDQWQEFIDTTSGLTVEDKIARVNSFFNNKIEYVEDQFLWGKADYWATPLETLGRSQGDCEDFALAKYVSLRLLGVPAEQLRLTYVRARVIDCNRSTTRAHMVLSYYPLPGRQPLILDSLNPDILSASARKDLYPIFSFNTEQLWVTGQSSPVSDSSARLSKWRDVLSRMHDEGFVESVLLRNERR